MLILANWFGLFEAMYPHSVGKHNLHQLGSTISETKLQVKMLQNTSGNAAAMFVWSMVYILLLILDLEDHENPQSWTMEIIVFDRFGRWKMGQFRWICWICSGHFLHMERTSGCCSSLKEKHWKIQSKSSMINNHQFWPSTRIWVNEH